MRALYGVRSTHDVGLYASMGMAPEEIKARVEAVPEAVGVWPEHWDALSVFGAMTTQWRTGMNGPTGLDYNAIPAVMRWCRIKPEKRSEVFFLVRTMETEALTLFSEQRNVE